MLQKTILHEIRWISIFQIPQYSLFHEKKQNFAPLKLFLMAFHTNVKNVIKGVKPLTFFSGKILLRHKNQIRVKYIFHVTLT